jgi:chloramphenicol O-acetyltransferase type A
MTYQLIDVNNWNRKEHFLFYKTFSNPFFGLVIDVDCTKCFHRSKISDNSFLQEYLYACIRSINEVPALRNRIHGDELRQYNDIHVSSTVLREDKTFGFSFIEYSIDKTTFANNVSKEVERVRNTTGLFTSSDTAKDNVIHFSVLPWISFSGIEHASNIGSSDSCPKISIGKMKSVGDQYLLPVSLHVHHACADGYDAGLFFELLQKYMDNE